MTAADLIALHAIRNTLARHSQGVDRADANLLASAYFDDAAVNYGFFAGPAATLVAILAGAQKAALPTLHRTCNSDIRLAGDRAVSESLVIAHAEEPAESGPNLRRMVFGRYLDRHERRGGEWRLVHRTYVLDSNINRHDAGLRSDPLPGDAHFVPQGGKGAADPARALMTQYCAAARHLQKARPMETDAAALDAALSREEIRRLIYGYCRAADRADADLMASLFWDDATVISGVSNGSAADFARAVTDHVRTALEACFHSVANEWVEVKGDHAVGEHYVIAHDRAGGTERLTGGRYVDSYERRNGTWKIAARSFVSDWTATHPSTFEPAGFYEGLTTRGCFGRNDPIYKHWESL